MDEKTLKSTLSAHSIPEGFIKVTDKPIKGLSPEQKAVLNRKGTMLFNEGKTNKDEIFKESLTLLDKDIEIEYLEVCDIKTLDYCKKIGHNSFVAIAAKIGGVRLIDNVVIN